MCHAIHTHTNVCQYSVLYTVESTLSLPCLLALNLSCPLPGLCCVARCAALRCAVQGSLTFAPEAGTQRMRDIINKVSRARQAVAMRPSAHLFVVCLVVSYLSTR